MPQSYSPAPIFSLQRFSPAPIFSLQSFSPAPIFSLQSFSPAPRLPYLNIKFIKNPNISHGQEFIYIC
jgi:hypothetical protein